MTSINIFEKTSFGIECSFKDQDGVLVTPENLTYTITNDADDTLIRTNNVVPTSPVYVIPVSVADNTIVDIKSGSERRKVVIEFTYNAGQKGGVEVYYYTIENVN